MKASCLLVVLAFPAVFATNPVSKVIDLLSGLEAKVTVEGDVAKKEYTEFVAWCAARTKELAFEIKTGKGTAADLNAKIDQANADIEALTTKIDELGANLATDEADLKAATEIRAREEKDFSAEQAELSEAISTLERAIRILQREAQKGGASMLQMNNVGNLAEALSAMVEASAISAADSSRLTALVQNSEESDDVGAPDAAVYKSHSGDIIGTLQGILDKAEAQMSTLRHTETGNLNNFQLLKQSIVDEIRFGQKDMSAAKKGLAATNEAKAVAQGDLAVTVADLDGDEKALGATERDCRSEAEKYEADTASRTEELKALAEAKKVLLETTGGADTITYGLAQVSFLQTMFSSNNANFAAVRFVRDLARKHHSPALTQLASQMASTMRFSAQTDSDPFAKVKGLIAAMISRLESEADADATHKAFCDKHLAETREKKADKTAEIKKLTTQIDQMSARSALLKEEIAALNTALANLHASQIEMDKMRADETAAFNHNKAELEEGMHGVQLALKILRDYYAQDDKAHGNVKGDADGIIGLLEVVESDFTKMLAESSASEQAAQTQYEEQTKANQIEQASKEQDVKYKTKESTGLDKSVADTTSDRSGVQTELDAVMQYLSSLENQCIEVAETYEERRDSRAAEIAGLHQALEILEGEAALIQQATRKTLRGKQ